MIWCHPNFFDLLHICCHTGAHSVSVEIHRFSWSCMHIPAHEDQSFDDWWFGAAWFYDLAQIWCHTGAYFIVGWDLHIFIELHTHPHLRDAHRDEDVFVILSWSPGGASLEPSSQTHIFSAFVCHHASYLGRRFLDVWVRFGLRRSHIWWWMISCHLISDLPHIYAILGHISFSVESYRSS